MHHTVPNTMRAVQIDQPGPPAGLALHQVPVPTPGPDQVLIRVAYVGMNPIDAMARAGLIRFLPITWPFVPGLEKSGVVVAVGPGVDHTRLGQRVLARVGFGGYADFVLAPTASLIALDPRIDLKTGCAYRGSSSTAWHALYKAGRLGPSETVLVHSAAGAIGIMATQIAKSAGCTVIGLCGGPAKIAFARPFGADTLIDYTAAGWDTQVMAATRGRGCDVIIDGNGGPNAGKNVDLAAPLGRIVYIGATAGGYPATPAIPTLMFKNLAVVGMNLAPIEEPPDGAAHRQIVDHIATGAWKVPISETVPLAQVADLHTRLEQRRVMGRAVIEVNGDSVLA